MTARQTAVKALYEIEKNGAYASSELKKLLSSSELKPVDKAFATELVYGTIKNKTRLDYIISKYSKQKLKKLSIWILNILRVGIYQLILLDKIPHSAAVNESVKLAKRYGHPASAGFVNGVLRSVSKNGDVEYPKGREFYEVYYSHPKWLVDMIFEQYPNEATEIIENNNLRHFVTVRVNPLKTTADDVLKSLAAKGVDAVKTEEPSILKISGFGDVSALDEYKDGLITPQGLCSYLAAKTLGASDGDFVIDLCAAPGGKTAAIAEMCGDKAEIHSFDLYEHKVTLIENNCKRLGVKNVSAKVSDSSVYMPEYNGKADKVLADVPCSGLGIIHKKPDIKWNRNESDFKDLCSVQERIFKNASAYLKSGGTMVYSTCTINKNENEKIAVRLAEENGMKVISSKTFLPSEDYDGFYICKLIKE